MSELTGSPSRDIDPASELLATESPLCQGIPVDTPREDPAASLS